MPYIKQVTNETFIIKALFSSGYYYEMIRTTGAKFARPRLFRAHENSVSYYTMMDHQKRKVLKCFNQYPSPISVLPFDPASFKAPTFLESNWLWMTQDPLEIIKVTKNQTIQRFPTTPRLSIHSSPHALTQQYKHFQFLLGYLLLKKYLR